MILYYMGFILMTLGFLICFNAAFRAPLDADKEPVDITAGIEAESAAVRPDSGFTVLEGRGDPYGGQ
jgi:hypothetical protein